jgi:hypothetical protein
MIAAPLALNTNQTEPTLLWICIFKRHRPDHLIKAWGLAPGRSDRIQKKARLNLSIASDIKERRFEIAVLLGRRFQTAAP